MAENTSQSYPPLLPRLKDDHRISNFPRPGSWDEKQTVDVDALSEGLDIERIDPRYVDINCIPDMWARPLLLRMALYDSSHLLHERILGEWRGLLAMLALKEIRNLTSLNVMRVDIPESVSDSANYQGQLDFIHTLAQVIPADTLSNDTPWNSLYVIVLGENPIGITSPTTLVCTAADYYNRIQGIAWFDGQLLFDPIPLLNRQEKESLSSWLNQLMGNLLGHPAGLNADIRVPLFRLLGEFQRDLGGTPAVPVPLSDSRLGMNVGFFRYLDRPIKGKEEIEVEESHVLLRTSREQESVLSLLVVDREIPEQWSMPEQEVIVWGTTSVASIPFSGLGSERTRYADRQLPSGVQLRTPEDFFTDRLFVIYQVEAFPGAMSPNNADSLQQQGSTVTPIIPITDELLNYLTVDDLRRRIRFEQRTEGIAVRLRLPLSGPDGSGKDFEVDKEFGFADNKVVLIPTVPVLEVWPNYTARDWEIYYTYFSTAAQDTFYAEPWAVGPDPAAQTFKDSDDQIERQVTRGTLFPEAMKCKYLGEEAGILLLRRPQPVPLQTRQWKVGVDFGTTATNVYVYDHQRDPFPIQFEEKHFLQVTASGIRRSRLLTEFLPGSTQETEFLSIFDDFRRTTEVVLRPLLDGHIYFVVEYEFDVTAPGIAVDLKWSQKPDDRIRVRAFLEQLCLQCASEAAAHGVREIKWMFAFPAAFSVADQQSFRQIWKQIAGSCSQATGIDLTDASPEDEPESIASARFFVDHMQAPFVSGTVCIDIGGGTSDISIWQDNELRWHTSLQFAGRHIFLDLLYRNLEFLRYFVDDKIMESLEKTRGDRAKFYAQADALITDQGQKWLDEDLANYSPLDEVKGVVQLIAIGLAGLYYYVGLLLQHLHKNRRYNARMPNVYVAGNGAKMFHWVADGKYDNRSPINELFKAMLLRASDFRTAPDLFDVTISSKPKAEVSFGLVSEEPTLTYNKEQLKENEVLAGEAFMKSGRKHDWDEKLSSEDLANGLDAVEELEQLENFIRTFDMYAKPGNFVQIPIAPDNRLMNDIYKRLASEVKRHAGKEASIIHVEPIFITALKILLDIKAQEWTSKQKPRHRMEIAVVQEENLALNTLCEDYNAGVESTDRKAGFTQSYQPLRIGVVNAMERRQDLDIVPIFQTMEEGDYLAIAIEGSANYAIIPRFDLTFEEFSYGPGAMGHVFDCPNYNPFVQYRSVKVVKPAIFGTDSARQKWELKEKGELDLGKGE